MQGNSDETQEPPGVDPPRTNPPEDGPWSGDLQNKSTPGHTRLHSTIYHANDLRSGAQPELHHTTSGTESGSYGQTDLPPPGCDDRLRAPSPAPLQLTPHPTPLLRPAEVVSQTASKQQGLLSRKHMKGRFGTQDIQHSITDLPINIKQATQTPPVESPHLP